MSRVGSQLIVLIVAFLFSSPASASVDAFEEYPVLKAADYNAATGCTSDLTHYDSLAITVGFLAGTSDEEISYVQRETKALFESLLERTPEDFLDGKCLHASVWRVGVAIDLINAEGAYVGKNISGRYDKAAQKWDNVIRNQPESTDTSRDNPAFILLPRSTFMERTECLVSPSTYTHYVKAFAGTLFDFPSRDEAKKRMKLFMEDLYESRPAAEGVVDERCMVPGIKRVADALGLLDEQGRYHSSNR
ncbi:MAG: hypothetical protein HOL61_13675 [Rhodospirillaceae bacterium]|nr:hypothetical protein [Rhodospirillaceae bacterium]